MKTLKNSRVAYVDIAKGIAITAVVLLHVDFVYPKFSFINLSGVLGWYWHVPVFFLIGGFFLKEERLLQPISFIKGKLKSLYLLSLYIYLPATLLHNFFFKIGWYSPDVVYGGKIIDEWNLKEYFLGFIKTFLCAGREPIMGAMWFVYALLFALCGYSIISYIVYKFNWNKYVVPIILLALQIISCVATNIYEITIPRFSNAVSVMLLLYVGQQLYGRLKFNFDNPYLFVTCIFIVYESSLLTGPMGLAHNGFEDVLHLTVGSTASLYVLCFISKKLEKLRIGKIIEICGRDSFYIMGLHFFGFKLCTMLLMALGIVDGGLEYLKTPQLGDNVILLVIYTLCGVFFPVGFMFVFRKIKSSVLRKFHYAN